MKLLKKLIEIPSVSGGEKKIQKFIYKWLSDVGLNPEWCGDNLAVKIAGEDSTKCMIFNAHVDTVVVGGLKQWKYPPFSGKVVGGKIFGLGASDEKAGVAALMLLGKQLLKEKPACDVWLVFVVKEEVDGSGTRDFLKWFVR